MGMPKLSKVGIARGAPMGRRDTHDTVDAGVMPGKFHLQKMRMVDGAYDEGGAYWGAGNSEIGWMYRAYSQRWNKYEEYDEHVEMFVRARSRDEAKVLVRDHYEDARFYR